METCRCEEYRNITKKLRPWTIATYHPLRELLTLGEEARLYWKRNKTSNVDYRFFRPKIYTTVPRSICPESHKKEIPKLENKWIPVLPGLVSQRLVNESKGNLKGPF
ncbi:uncharacterized protein LOC116174019 [Photinus pyralis]|uniref:uncharacterized protein LOC116174019 n=1 Tax=Photinus pyralis TaxID=7054 RepID=UPI0012671EB8|nr:uncharacterized protein LOC116174019 [Photinus pyralis]